MPMHDWTRVTPNDYHSFHVTWIGAILGQLNGGLLPPEYFALAEHSTPPYVPDVVTVEWPDSSERPATATATLPVARVRQVAARPGERQNPRRISIQQMPTRRMVAIVEIVSPSNKAKRRDFDEFVVKNATLLQNGVHVVVLDPFPPTACDPHGVHAAIWEHLTGEPVPAPDRPSTMVSYCSGAEWRAFVEPAAVGDTLPNLPLFLQESLWVTLDLEASYRAAWAAFPLPLRNILTA